MKPLFKQFKFKSLKKNNSSQLRFWFSTYFLSKRESQPAPDPTTRPAYAAEMRVEGINESANSPAKPVGHGSSQQERSPKPPKSPEQLKSWQWPLVWLAALAVLGGMGTAALLWLVTLPPQTDCRNPARLTLDMERLYCAQEAAQTGDIAKLIAGIDFLRQWQPDHPLYGEAQRLIESWSDQVLTIAIRRVERGDLKGAEAALSHLPPTTKTYAIAQKSLARWRKYSKNASSIYAKAQTAMKQKDWSAVSDQIVLLAEFERDHWELEKGADALVQQLGVEKQAWKTLSQAQRMAASSNLQQLGAAIPVAQQVPDKTYAAAVAKANLKQWSQKLLSVGSQKWQQGDRQGAVTVLELAPTVKNMPEIADLFRFSHAYKLANSALSQQWVPSVGNLLNLTEAIAAVGQVNANSPFYAQAQTLKKNWQAQLQDLIQLQYASAAASLGREPTLEFAVTQAKQISADRPRRKQAQSLIAYWEGEVERLEDQPIFDRAVQTAKAGTIEALQDAIAQASEIDLGRSLRRRAQTWIATWRAQIQTLEDRPKLDQAWDLAKQGKLNDAILAAGEVQPGRSLYREAQNAIQEWRYQQVVATQTAQDEPILNRANSLAEAGNLSAAIDVASQISSGRALYGRAQSAISRWENQLNPPPPEPSAPSSEFDTYAPSDELFPNDDTRDPSPPLPTEGSVTFPSPTLSPGQPALRLEPAAPPRETYQPFPEPTVIPDDPLPPKRANEPPASNSEPLPADPLPPAPDPLPPSP